MRLDIEYTPQPKQALLHDCPANEILFGGSAGPGKSYAIRHEALIWASRIPKLQVYVFRRTYPELEKNHILPILLEWGETYGKYNEQKRRYTLHNRACIHMCHAQHDKDVLMYHGAEIHLLVIDELSTFSEWQYVYLRNRVRCTLDIPPHYKNKVPGIICGSNPGGPGHEFCKRTFVDFCQIDSQEAKRRLSVGEDAAGPVYEHPSRRLGTSIHYGVRRATQNEGGMLRTYIPALLEDNQILMRKDPGYINRVKAMPEPYRSAYLDGDWEIFIGQMFSFNKHAHVCPPHPLPKYAPIAFSFDWGFGKPFSCNWFYTDADGRIFLFTELYGWNKIPDQGLRKSDSEIAEMIVAHELRVGLRKPGGPTVNGFDIGRRQREVDYILSPDCFSRKPDYKGGGQGPSTSEVFAEYDIIGHPGDATRDQKVKQFHERLRVPTDPNERPMFQVFDTCSQFIRTIPLLQQDEHNAEDVDTDLEDHIYDAVALMFMSRPLSLEVPPAAQRSTDRRIQELVSGHRDDREEVLVMAADLEHARLDGDEWSHLDDGEEYDDGLVDTVN
jgi:hypothetical protein